MEDFLWDAQTQLTGWVLIARRLHRALVCNYAFNGLFLFRMETTKPVLAVAVWDNPPGCLQFPNSLVCEHVCGSWGVRRSRCCVFACANKSLCVFISSKACIFSAEAVKNFWQEKKMIIVPHQIEVLYDDIWLNAFILTGLLDSSYMDVSPVPPVDRLGVISPFTNGPIMEK